MRVRDLRPIRIRTTGAVLCALLLVFPAAASALSTSARSSVLMERDSGRVLYIDNGHEIAEMASTTKIMTCILAIERGNLEDEVVVSKNASGVEGSSIWLARGEKIKLRDLLYGLMLASGNDAAVAVAEHIGGSMENFVDMMNLKAAEIGALNTNFANPNGLHHESHYSTAFDMARISCYAMRNPVFAEIVKTQYKNIPWEGHEYERVVKNKNKILWEYEGGNGIKTGYTKKAGKCLCAAAQRNGMQLVAVVFDDGDMFRDCMGLLDYGFENYANYTILGEGEKAGTVEIRDGRETRMDVFVREAVTLPLTAEEYRRVQKRVSLEKSVRAPVRKGQTTGRVDILLDGGKMASVPLRAPRAVEENTYPYNFYKIIGEWLHAKAQ